MYSPSSLHVVDCSFTNNTAFTGILALFSLCNLIIPERDRSELRVHIFQKAVNGPARPSHGTHRIKLVQFREECHKCLNERRKNHFTGCREKLSSAPPASYFSSREGWLDVTIWGLTRCHHLGDKKVDGLRCKWSRNFAKSANENI